MADKKVLEQKYYDEYISKGALHEALYDNFHDDEAPFNITEVTLGSVRNFVKDFPSEKGKWENKNVTGHHFYGKCSKCGQELVVDVWYAQNMNYCPNCGLKMENGGLLPKESEE